MVRFRFRHLFCLAILSGLTNTIDAEIVIDHPPHNFGGPASDTEFLLPPSPGVFWQRLADDFVLPAATTIRRVNFWGFYNDDNPPLNETMRIRFYGARTGDGLPDESQTLYEQSVLNPSRTWTGRFVGTGVIPREYLYSIDLSSPLQLVGGTAYWLEFVQVGDPTTNFRWEFSLAQRNRFAFINNNPGVTDWMLTTLEGDLAFQLSTVPEATVLVPLVLCLLSTRLRRGREHFGEWR